MIQRCINLVTDISCAKFVKEEMFRTAIRTNGVYDTFDFCEGHTHNDNTQLLHLDYMQVTYEEIANISEYHYKVMYFTDADCFGDAKHIGEQYYDATVDKIKEDLVKDKNAIWSTISVNEVGFGDKRRFEIRYKRVVNTNDAKKPSEIYIEPKSCDTSTISVESNSDQLEVLQLLEQLSQDFFEIYRNAVATPYVQKPVSYALYHTWKQWNDKESPRGE